ncbi:hypothetical protein MMC07_005055 [Pseudocyphellaria aurata]|nr:hypothetical protein [Pseudocyphellaria aurata]
MNMLETRMILPWWLVFDSIVVASVVLFLLKGYLERSRAIKLRRQGFSMPPHHPIVGHIFILAGIMSKLPKDAYPHYLADQLRRTYPDLGPIYYLDAWPFITLTLVVASPATMAQITTAHVLPKFPAIKDFLYPLANGLDLVSMEGQEWKYWRNMFNPGFSASHLMTLVPDIIKETMVFLDILNDHAIKQDVFRMKDLTDNLAMDVIGKVVLDSTLGCQRKSNLMVNALRRQMRWMAFGGEGNPFKQYHPFRPLVHWYNTWQMDRYISPEVDARFELHRAASMSEKSTISAARGRSVIDLTLAAYLKRKDLGSSSEVIDPLFKMIAINQMKLFLFSGHDTTSSTICYVLYLLSLHPHVLSRVRAEHDYILGSIPSQTAARIAEDPSLLNKLSYTTATIKESMRLFPAAFTTRSGETSFTITDPRNGLRYPADPSMLIWLVSHACQHDPSFWPRADDFLPERWLSTEGDELYPTRGAWRPFEHGPRACIGQELSMIELRVVVCLVARAFEISTVYEELDGEAVRRGKRTNGRKVKGVDGERAYQVGKGEPSDHLPCRVKKLMEKGVA